MLSPSEKGPLSSLTITSAASSLIVSALGAGGIEIGSQEVNFILSGILAAVAIYGRWRATKLIKK